MLHARIIALALVAIAITSAIAIGVGKVGAQTPTYPHISGNGQLVETEIDGEKQCAYRLSVESVLRDGDTTDGMTYRLRHTAFERDPLLYGAFPDHGKIQIGPFPASKISEPTRNHGKDTYDNPMPPRDEVGIWFWSVRREYGINLFSFTGGFLGPYRDELHQRLLRCATPPTPTPEPTATPTPSPTPTATPDATPTPSATPPASVATPRPTATPRSGARVHVTATPTTIPTPSPTATLETPGAGGAQGDDPDLAEVLRQLTAALNALVQWLSSQQQ